MFQWKGRKKEKREGETVDEGIYTHAPYLSLSLSR